MSVSCEYSVLSEGSPTGQSLVQTRPTVCGVSVCDRGASQGRPMPTRAVNYEKKFINKRHTRLPNLNITIEQVHHFIHIYSHK
jgi:hypothetical protein